MTSPVIFLHGIGAGADGYQWLQPLVPDSEALDMPGFGEEPWRRPATWETLADWLHGKLAGKPPAILFGHSFGGMLALEMAIRHPDDVAGIVNCASTPAFGGRDDSFKQQFLKARLDPLDKGKTMLDVGRGSAAMAAPGTDPDRLEAFAQSMGRVPQAVFRDILECLTTFNRRDDLGRVTVPVACISGAADQAAPAKTVKRMHEALPDSELTELPCGHLIPLEDPEACAAVIARLRQRLESAP
ncbi:MAG: alpha/beta hydrolase [Pseudomonadota bacterium]